jgi:hypothetical protein
MRRLAITGIVSLLLAISSTMCTSNRVPPSLGEATIYPVPTGETPSPRYEVRVIDKSGVARQSFVYFDPARQVTTPGNHGTDLQAGRSFSWTTFEIDGAVKVQVVRTGGSFKSVKLRPSRYALAPGHPERQHHRIRRDSRPKGLCRIRYRDGQVLFR